MNIQKVAIDKVKPYDLNSKKHPKDQVAGIAESIKKFGWDQPIVVDRDFVIIKGHGRRLAAIELGMKEVPVLVRDDLTPEAVKAARLADNRTALSDIDTEMLRLEMADINKDLLKGIYTDKELDYAVADLGAMSQGAFIDDVDAAVEKQDQETKERVEKLQVARVPLVKVLGFKDVQGADEIYYSRFIARAEEKTGLKGEQAVTAFVKELVGPVSQG